MTTDRFEARQQKLLRVLRKHDVDAVLVTSITNVTYLTGFSGDSSFLLIGRDIRILVSDSRYSQQVMQGMSRIGHVYPQEYRVHSG